MKEEFKEVVGFEYYQISNLGNIKTFVKSKEGRLLKPQKDKMGYLHVRLYDGTQDRGVYKNGWAKPKLEKVHRLVATHFLDAPTVNTYQEVNHRDGNKENNGVTNLEWVSRKDNIRHAWKLGLMSSGSVKGGLKRRRPIRITHQDGRIEIFESTIAAAISLGCSVLSVSARLNGRTTIFGRVGFMAEKLDKNLNWEEFYVRIEGIEEKLKEYARWQYEQARKCKEKKLNKKLVDR